jgi:hypothetical protein
MKTLNVCRNSLNINRLKAKSHNGIGDICQTLAQYLQRHPKFNFDIRELYYF